VRIKNSPLTAVIQIAIIIVCRTYSRRCKLSVSTSCLIQMRSSFALMKLYSSKSRNPEFLHSPTNAKKSSIGTAFTT
jgi:hypothetical protein